MPKGEKLTQAHQTSAAMRPRPGRKPSKQAVEAQRMSGETMDQATLRLQVARADTEELDRAKRDLELRQARGDLVTKDEAVDLAQAAVLRVCQILDLLPERLRDRSPTISAEILVAIDEIIRDARTQVASGA
jgi:hypothetical protein